MSTKFIDGKCYLKMLSGGAAMLSLHTEELNALNVFPVADGDTGTNMLKTIEGGLSAAVDSDSIGEVSKKFSRGILLGARGNSGVILSQIFAGLNEVLSEKAEVDAEALVKAYRQGIDRSYAAVQKPTEGTILTVFRESTEYAAKNINADSSVEDFYRLHIEEAKRSLKRTPELLPALAEAGVVDSGAAGYLNIAIGMLDALEGKEITYEPTEKKSEGAVDIDRFTRDSVLEFGYCTEFLLRLTTAKADYKTFEVSRAVDVLKELGGESIVAYKEEDILKVHVHTFNPGAVLSKMQEYGEFLTVKIENMSLGHSDTPKKSVKKDFAVVAVAQGEGMSSLFTDMGADMIVSGGQSANPAISDFVDAFGACDAESIIVLPNNKNIILAARQAAELYTDARVCVLNTKNMAQGYAALSVITPGIKDIDALITSAERAAADVIGGEITRAVRDTVVNEREIHEGDYIAISGGEIVSVEKTPEDALCTMLAEADIDLCEIITLFVGKGVSDERRAALTERLKELYEDFEINVYEGGQDVYDYLVAVE
ncbi:MAG: DAK2 domain-containing protein [Clostridia bacterium]|nr:DAK2 domain-containing protein [Clostridia bacterium]